MKRNGEIKIVFELHDLPRTFFWGGEGRAVLPSKTLPIAKLPQSSNCRITFQHTFPQIRDFSDPLANSLPPELYRGRIVLRPISRRTIRTAVTGKNSNDSSETEDLGVTLHASMVAKSNLWRQLRLFVCKMLVVAGTASQLRTGGRSPGIVIAGRRRRRLKLVSDKRSGQRVLASSSSLCKASGITSGRCAPLFRVGELGRPAIQSTLLGNESESNTTVMIKREQRRV